MGLDTYIHSVTQPEELERVYNRLAGDEPEKVDVFYWRKNWEIVEWIGEYLGEAIENTESYEITKTAFEDFLKAFEDGDIEANIYDEQNEIEIIKRILKETDFTKTKFYFYNWW